MTATEAAAYLSELGLQLPAPLLDALVLKIDAIDTCMTEKGYTTFDKSLIRYYAIGLLAITSGGRRVQSQSAPSGASRSYSYGSLVEQQRQLTNALRLVDIDGCADDLIPAEPGGKAGLWVARGICYE